MHVRHTPPLCDCRVIKKRMSRPDIKCLIETSVFLWRLLAACLTRSVTIDLDWESVRPCHKIYYNMRRATTRRGCRRHIFRR